MRLENWMQTEKITQKNIADLLGVKQSTISRWIRGRQFPSVQQLLKIEKITSGNVNSQDFVKSLKEKEKL